MKSAVRLPTALRTLAQSGSLTKSKFAKSPKRASLMSISLYDLSVPTFLQTVNALGGVLDRADEHCAKTGHHPDDFVEVRFMCGPGMRWCGLILKIAGALAQASQMT